MGLYAAYWVDCDICGEGADSSRPTQDEAWAGFKKQLSFIPS